MEKVRFLTVISCPSDQVTEADRVFHSHIDWMKQTHQKTGPKGLLSYDVSKTAELLDPFDPASKSTGKTNYILTEVYNTDAGVTEHFDLAESGWKDYPAFNKLLGNCTTTKVRSAKIFNSLWEN